MRRSGSRRELHRYIGYIKIGAVVLALIIAFFLVRGIRNRIVLGDTDKFYNVTVNGINLKGYTRNQSDRIQAGHETFLFLLYNSLHTWYADEG